MDDKLIKTMGLVQEAISAVEEMIQNGDCSEYPGIQAIRADLYEIINTLKRGRLPGGDYRNLGIGRTIIDSWPIESMKSQLSDLLIRAEDAYIAL